MLANLRVDVHCFTPRKEYNSSCSPKSHAITYVVVNENKSYRNEAPQPSNLRAQSIAIITRHQNTESTDLLHRIVPLLIQRLAPHEPNFAVLPPAVHPLRVLPRFDETHEQNRGDEYDAPFPADGRVFEDDVVDNGYVDLVFGLARCVYWADGG